MPAKYVLEQPSTNTILVNGLPESFTGDDLEGAFKKYGKVVSATADSGSGAVTFTNPVPVDDIMMDADDIEVGGSKLDVQRMTQQVPACLGMAPFKAEAANLDTLVIRGACTATAMGLAALAAQSTATTVVLWNRKHTPMEEANVGGIRKATYEKAGEDEMPDQAAMTKASEVFGAAKPRCALVHVVSDQLLQAQRSALKDDELIKSQGINFMETYQAYTALHLYAPWVHAVRACAFVVIPSVAGQFSAPAAAGAVETHRLIEAQPLRLTDGSGWTVGLQLKDGQSSRNAGLVFSTVVRCAGDDEAKAAISGKIVNLESACVQVVPAPGSLASIL